MLIENVSNQRILVSPLDWGWGHVSRCIGLIDRLKKQGNEMLVAGTSAQQEVFQQYFPNLECVDHAGYGFRFGGKGHFALDLLKDARRLSQRARQEQNEVDDLVEEYAIDLVISDHRYGFRSSIVPSIFVTHQLNLPVRWWEKAGQRRHVNFMKAFSQVWVMDRAQNRLAGKLSEPIDGLSTSYIGLFSRFARYGSTGSSGSTVAIISGPQVYGQQFLNSVVEQYPGVTVICDESLACPDSTQRISGNWLRQDQVILSASKIISRSGYSTLMDLEELGIEAILVPTPGQSEQQYFARRYKREENQR